MLKGKIIPLVLFLLLTLLQTGLSANASSGTIHYISVEGVVNPVMAEFLVKGIKNAGTEKAEAIIIQIDTPGGLDLSMRDIVKAILAAEVPVVVYVAPAGSRAASAGVFITYAANVAAMAPGTNIGSAHPVSMGGEKMDETMSKKVENDAVAYIKGIAAKRKRNAGWAENAVRKSVNITAEEALRLNVIDMLADNGAALIAGLDGRKAELSTGQRVIRSKGAEVQEIKMNLRYRVLNAISNPNVAYILMLIGIAGLYFELSSPGAILPGVVGAVCLVLAFYSFQTLPINYAGLLLIGLAFIFFIVEIKVVSYGLLSIAGIISFVLGSLMLFDSPLPYMRLSLWVMLPAAVALIAAILSAMYYAVRIHKRKPVSGAEGLVGEEGAAADDIAAGETGKVFVAGEYWNAVSEASLKKDDKVKVVEVKGLTLKVVKS